MNYKGIRKPLSFFYKSRENYVLIHVITLICRRMKNQKLKKKKELAPAIRNKV